ncbi:hypothetical protein [Luteolibacter marinus]|uniref:hypothetical protein n=1 Tax=Luteolibacter marinus TaxID=2776705 RepID=UPI001865D198|nr:hypothetical protein [Luteolibacter marinus]
MRPSHLLALALLASPLAAQESLFLHIPDPKSKTRVEAVALFSRAAPCGYLPVRITVNNASEKDGAINLGTTSSDGRYGGEGSEMSSSFRLDAPAGKATVHDILVPCTTVLNFYGSGQQSIEFRLSGSFGSNSTSLTTSNSEEQPAVLLSEALYTPNASSLDSAANSKLHSRYGGITFAGKFDPRQMPEDWRAYAGYDGLGMTDADWTSASPGARNAMLRWNRLGGQLVIYAMSGSSDLASLGISDEGKGVRSATRSFGEVTIIPVAADLKLDHAATVNRFSKRGLPPLSKSIQDDFGAGWPLKTAFGEQGYNYGLFIIILIAFGILVGPVNLFVFAKSGRRHRLFITTPLIALGTSVILIALIIGIDGFGGRGTRVALMEVRPDGGENSAYVRQEQISRTGVLLGGDFKITEPALITPVPLESTPWSRLTQNNQGGGMRYEFLLRDGTAEIDGDWFQSRSEQGQLVRAVIPTRGRIEARNQSGPPAFLSSFDFGITTLFYQDKDGGVWRADNISPGKAFICTASTVGDFKDFAKEAQDQFGTLNRMALKNLQNRTGHFLAVTDAAPGIETLPGIKWQQTLTYLTGPIAQP